MKIPLVAIANSIAGFAQQSFFGDKNIVYCQ